MVEPIPSPRTVDRAAARAFLRQLLDRYQVEQVILFRSRARVDHRPDSDRGDCVDAKLDMAGMAFDVLLETGVLVQVLPLWEDDLQHPEHFANPALIRMIAAEGIRLA